jgi:putative DNA primase/helicase
VSSPIENQKSQIENHPSAATIEDGNRPEMETSIPASAETQAPIENQNSTIENPPDEEDYHPVWHHLGNPPPPPESDESVVDRLAPLSAFDYDRVRKFEASKLNIRVEVLDREVGRRQNELRDEREFQAVLATLYTPEPWPEPVDAPAVFDEISSRFKLYLVLPPGAADVFALWAAQTHVFRAFDQTPRLNLYSPVSGCGKTTAMELLSTFVPRGVRTENLRAAVIFRLVHSCQPTLLLDELDTYLAQEEELRGILNAGHRRGATVYRCKGEVGFHKYQAFAPAALAGIGNLPATLHNRSIQIRLTKAKPGELPAHFTSSNIETEALLARKLARWAKDNFEALKQIRPVLPPNAYNRLGDNWRPLFAIAELIGGDWPARCLASFNQLTARHAETESIEIMLLADIRQIFAGTGFQRITSKDLLAKLLNLPDRPWNEAYHSKSITDMWLAEKLKVFDIAPKTLRIGETRAKGYERSWFESTFARFLT